MNLNHTISIELFTEIENYLLKLTSQEERQAFEQKTTSDTTLQEQVQQVRLTITGIKEASLQHNLGKFHSNLPKSEIKTIPLIKKTGFKRWLVAATVLAAVAVGSAFFFTRLTPNEKLFTTYFKPDPGLISAMGSTDNYVFEKAMIDYKTGRYELAITAWQTLLKTNNHNDTLNYFIGAGYMALQDTKTATPYLQKVTAMPQSYFVKDAYWYLGLAMIKEQSLKEAKDFISKSEDPEKEQILNDLNK